MAEMQPTPLDEIDGPTPVDRIRTLILMTDRQDAEPVDLPGGDGKAAAVERARHEGRMAGRFEMRSALRALIDDRYDDQRTFYVPPGWVGLLLAWGNDTVTMLHDHDGGTLFTGELPGTINDLSGRLMVERLRFWADKIAATVDAEQAGALEPRDTFGL